MIESKTPSTLRTPAKPMHSAGNYAANPSGIVVGLTLNMAWQLAIVVLLPLLGGHELDVRLDSTPVWTIAGLIVAMAAMVVVVRRTLSQLNEHIAKSATKDKEESH